MKDPAATLADSLMVGLPGTEVDATARRLVEDLGVGGVILFARNVVDPWQVAKLCAELQDMALEKHGRPLLLAVDQEGGVVARLREPFTHEPGHPILGQSGDPRRAFDTAARMARELAAAGFNVNFAPVLDVNTRGKEGVMLQRSFGSDPSLVAAMGAAFVQGLQQSSVMACAKHFPGIGDTVLDSHLVLPENPNAKERLARIELVPFRAAFEAGVASCMITHVRFTALDPDRPASLSPAVITGLLRREMGFDGLVVSDDLEMGAIANTFEVGRAAAMSYAAGADVMLVCHRLDRVENALETLVREVERGRLDDRRLAASRDRIDRARARFAARPRPDMDELRRLLN
ncbi:MAG: beta-N-acetylhexosaminidase [Proteobacteria bacterium]|nr:beta-N-acetylhexosaminidase [Pseudomonadota bacterium]MBU1740319.1 beta-N-acetylhexosaminidase [Pseudomonadota bacterium]